MKLAARSWPEMNICILAHGMGGTEKDWQTWVEVLSKLYPDWSLHPLQKLAPGCRFMGKDVKELSSLAADEILEILEKHRSQEQHLVLHCIGHSMGGLILRGALPKVLEAIDSMELGHYVSLSSPHLGIQSTWLQPFHAWRNLCWLSWPISNQLLHLAVQDCA
ncbi:unnamed protein product, partial [Effrenium voratum]